jgi:hypothetical protein
VIVKLIENAHLLGRKNEARIEAQRFSIPFPLQYGLRIEAKLMD